MASVTVRNSKPEIVSPAGNLEKLRFAVAYGADAVFFGGDEFNLRVKAGNFSTEDIETALALCGDNKVRSIYLVNSFLHEQDIDRAKDYLARIKNFKFDALMVSDPGMIALIRDAGIESAIHLSTQMSTLNRYAVSFWHRAGVKRIVLAREARVDEIKMIKDHSEAELEVFVHGALCIAYSGRCLLSRYLTGRDANLGDCSQPCRWNFSLIEKKRPANYLDILEHCTGTEVLSSKDLCLIEVLEDYVNTGVDAFKIEGRMKSLYYGANTTRVYKHALRCAGTGDFSRHMPFWLEELDLISHRPYTADLFNEFNNMGFDSIPYIKKALFMGYKASNMDGTAGPAEEILVKVFNPLYRGDTMDAIFPITDSIRDRSVSVAEIFDDSGFPVDMARPGEKYRIRFNSGIDDNAIFRKRLA